MGGNLEEDLRTETETLETSQTGLSQAGFLQSVENCEKNLGPEAQKKKKRDLKIISS